MNSTVVALTTNGARPGGAPQTAPPPSRSGRRLALAGLMLAALLNAHHTAWWCLPVLAAA